MMLFQFSVHLNQRFKKSFSDVITLSKLYDSIKMNTHI